MGRRFLFLAGGQVGSQTCAAVQLKGAAFGVRVPGCVKPGPRLLPRGALGEGPGGAPFGGGSRATWPAPDGQAGRRAGRRVRTDRPPCSAAAPWDLFCVFLLPGRLFLPSAAAAQPPRQPRRGSARARRSPRRPQASGRPLVAAPRVGPAPEEAPLGSRSRDETDRAAAPGSQPQRGAEPRFSATSRAPAEEDPESAKARSARDNRVAQKVWVANAGASGATAPAAFAAFPVATAPPSGPCRARSTAPSRRTGAAQEARFVEGGRISTSERPGAGAGA